MFTIHDKDMSGIEDLPIVMKTFFNNPILPVFAIIKADSMKLRHSFSWLLVLLLSAGCFRILPSKGGGEIKHIPARKPAAADVAVPSGYKVEVVNTGLTFPTAVTFDENNAVYVIESGYSYGEVITEPRLLRLEKDGNTTVIATGGKNGPWNGITYYDKNFYVAEGGILEGGKILRISKQGEIAVLLENLPSYGDHHTNGPVIHDGFLYFGQGTATNAGVVGTDNKEFGWLERFPDFHDIPCNDIILKGKNFQTSNVLTEAKEDVAKTGPYSAYNTQTKANQVIKGSIPCNGAIMRIPLEGGKPEVVAWGLRNPYGLAFSPEGELYITENSYDVRGSRPVWGTGDVLWKIEEDMWYGWPDFNAGVPITVFEVPGEEDPEFLLAVHPNEPPHPAANLGVHSSSNGISFSSSEVFGFQGKAFIAQFGDMAPTVGKVISPVGFKVVMVDVETGIVQDFAANFGKKNGPASWLKSNGLERPVSVQFSPDGSELYIVDFGTLTVSKKGSYPIKQSGVIWKVTKSN